MDDVIDKLEQITSLVEDARSMPLSASCVVNRTELLRLINELRLLLPKSLEKAKDVLDDRAGVVEEGRAEAARIIEQAVQDRAVMLSQVVVIQEAEAEAARIQDEARTSADSMRVEVEDYVDGTLANFEVVLGKTLSAVERGRSKLAGRHELDALREPAEDPDELPLPG